MADAFGRSEENDLFSSGRLEENVCSTLILLVSVPPWESKKDRARRPCPCVPVRRLDRGSLRGGLRRAAGTGAAGRVQSLGCPLEN